MRRAALIERDEPLERLRELLPANGRPPAVAIVQGPAGIGKSSVLQVCGGEADAAGVRVLRGQGGDVERERVFGVARQLFETFVHQLDGPARRRLLTGPGAPAAALLAGRAADGDPAEVIAALSWLSLRIAEDGPLVLAVDDLHATDADTARFLAHLARRPEPAPILVLTALRTGDPCAERDVVDLVLTAPQADVLTLAPLSPAGVGAVVGDEFARTPSAAFVSACHGATAGNPFLVRELVRELRERGADPDDATARTLRSVVPERVARDLRARLRQLGPDATALARAHAILGERAPIPDALQLAGLSVDAERAGRDALIEAEILAPNGDGFVHPLLRMAVLETLAPGERSRWHDRAAELLRARDAAPDAVAAQLVATDPAARRDVVEELLGAARWAMERSAFGVARGYLERALAEPPDEALRPALMLALGEVEWELGDPGAPDRLAAARDLFSAPLDRARAGALLASALAKQYRLPEAWPVINQALADVELAGDDDLRAALLAETSIVGLADQVGLDADPTLLPHHDGPGARLLTVALGWRLVQTQAVPMPWQELVDDVEAAMGGGRLFVEGRRSLGVPYLGFYVLMWADRFDAAQRLMEAEHERARRDGAPTPILYAISTLGQVELARGRVRDGLRRLEDALTLLRAEGAWYSLPSVTAHLSDALVESDRATEAIALIEQLGLAVELPNAGITSVIYAARARHMLAAGRIVEAADLALVAAERLDVWETHNPVCVPWRDTAIAALASRGDLDQARSIADEGLALARAWGAPRGVAELLAARAAAGLADDPERDCRAALERLAGVGAELTEAKTFHALGTALLAQGRAVEAREPLRAALDLAHRLGAARVERLARDGLIKAGGRPRRAALVGEAALTPTERRVASLAARGLTNAQIAEQLIVSPRTVEMHMTNAMRKLGVSSRRDLRR